MAPEPTDFHLWFASRLWLHVADLLDADEGQRMEAHLAECAACRDAAATLRAEPAAPARWGGHLPPDLVAAWPRVAPGLQGLERRLVRQHLERCAQCREDLELLGYSPALVGASLEGGAEVPVPEVTEEAAALARGSRRQRERAPGWWQRWQWAFGPFGAAAAVATVVVVFLLIRQPAEPIRHPAAREIARAPAQAPGPPAAPQAEPAPQAKTAPQAKPTPARGVEGPPRPAPRFAAPPPANEPARALGTPVSEAPAERVTAGGLEPQPAGQRKSEVSGGEAAAPTTPPAAAPAPLVAAKDLTRKGAEELQVRGGRADVARGLSAPGAVPAPGGPHLELPADLPFAALEDSVVLQVLGASGSVRLRLALPARSLYPRKRIALPGGPGALPSGSYRVRIVFRRAGIAQAEVRVYRLAIER